MEFFDRDGARGVDAACVDEGLQGVEIQGRHLRGETGRRQELSWVSCSAHLSATALVYVLVLEAALASCYDVWCLSSVEADGHTAVLFLSLVTTTGCLALA